MTSTDTVQPADALQTDTLHQALRIDLDPRWYGTPAEVGAGQEVARWLFRAGADGRLAAYLADRTRERIGIVMGVPSLLDDSWRALVPDAVAEVIVERSCFGPRRSAARRTAG